MMTENEAAGHPHQRLKVVAPRPVPNGEASADELSDGESARSAPAHKSQTLPLFYREPQPLRAVDHGALSLMRNGDYSFAKDAHAVPLQLEEFRSAAAHFPILFTEGDRPQTVALLGVRQDQNLFVDSAGRWEQDCYIPAYVRRYPFILARTDQEQSSTSQVLCVDLACPFLAGLAEGRDAEPLFETGAPSAFTKESAALCRSYEDAIAASRAFQMELHERGLLDSVEFNVSFPGGDRGLVKGLRLVSQQRFDALPDETFLQWRRKNWVAAVHWHWASLEAIGRLAKRG